MTLGLTEAGRAEVVALAGVAGRGVTDGAAGFAPGAAAGFALPGAAFWVATVVAPVAAGARRVTDDAVVPAVAGAGFAVVAGAGFAVVAGWGVRAGVTFDAAVETAPAGALLPAAGTFAAAFAVGLAAEVGFIWAARG